MRIISGLYKGRIITKSAPSGVRPTTDQARETIFNILTGYVDWESARVLDLCAGTGALGFEALSRGAAHCVFVELNRTTARHIENTARNLDIDQTQFTIHCGDCITYLRTLQQQTQFTILFTDPPYHKKLLNSIFAIVDAKSLVQSDGIIVAEHDLTEVVQSPTHFSLISTRKFGETIVDFFEIQDR